MLKEQLKILRENQKLTKKQVAEAIGISERAYIAYEYGERDVSTETLSKLADFYHVSTDYLLGRSESAPKRPIDEFADKERLAELEKILIEKYLELSDKQREAVLDFLRQSIREEEARQRRERQYTEITCGELEDMASSEREAQKGAGA